MIRSDILYDGRQSALFRSFIEAYPDLALETARDAINHQIKPGLLDELRFTPGPVQYPFQFATERSRRWYFANNRGNLPYRRTGALAAAWKVDVVLGDNALAMSASNNRREVRFVQGKRQVPGHARTGWQRFMPTLNFWAEAAIEVAQAAIHKIILK